MEEKLTSRQLSVVNVHFYKGRGCISTKPKKKRSMQQKRNRQGEKEMELRGDRI